MLQCRQCVLPRKETLWTQSDQILVTFSVVILQWVTSSERPHPQDLVGRRYVLQRGSYSSRSRRPGELDIGEALGLPEGQIVAQIRAPCPTLGSPTRLDETPESSGTGRRMLKDFGLIPNIPSTEDVASQSEKKPDIEDTDSRTPESV